MATDADSAQAEAEGEARDAARARRRSEDRGFGARLGAAVRETVIVVAMALALSFVVKTFLVQAFYIPSESMEDTLLVGDRVVVSKLTPGPFELKRGDVVVFSDPGGWLTEVPVENHGAVLNTLRDGLVFVGLLPNTSEGHLIKRIVGMPGDNVQCCDAEGRLLINGQPVDETYLKPGAAASSQEFNITVPAGKVWLMGDNRSDSSDSRFHDPSGTGAEGAVDIDLVVGRARANVWPFDRLGTISDVDEVFADVPRPATARSSAPVGAVPSGT